MKIAFFGVNEQEKIEYYKTHLADHELEFFADCLLVDNIPPGKDFDIVSVFVKCKADQGVINAFPSLKMISVRSTGFDNVDINYAKSKGIIVCNVPAYGSHTVAEFTFGLILALTRKVHEAAMKVKTRSQFNYEGLRGMDLFGKTLGVVGTGKIGKNVIKIAQGFGMNIICYDPYPEQEYAKNTGISYVSLDELLKNSDIATLHAPATPESEHLINKNNIYNMKKGALLINTARGKILETDALYQAITSKHLGGAALDVLEEEAELQEEAEFLNRGGINQETLKRVLEDHLLIKLPNVLITPHMAFYTKEAEESIMETTVANIKNFIEGNPQNVVGK